MTPQIWFTSDEHFDHENIMKHCSRPFETVEEMNAELIKRHNFLVDTSDTVYHLGDFSWWEKHDVYLAQLKGKHVLVKGNHDHSKLVKKSHLWAEICDIKRLRIKLEDRAITFFLSHYPQLSFREDINLHGHIHSAYDKPSEVQLYNQALMAGNRLYDVGVDNNAYAPINVEEILKKFNI